MKNTIKKISAFLLSLVLLFGIVPLADLDIIASAATYSGTCGDNLTWTFDSMTSELVISGEGEMYDWTYSSSVPWYSNRSKIKTVTIGDGATSIGNCAFYYCTSLTNIDIPDSVKSIGSSSFNNCTSLTSIEIPGSVTSIGSSSFYHCTSLTSIEIPGSVTSIGNNVFEYCDNLTKVTIGNGVTSIGVSAFYGCKSLTNIIIPKSVTNIDGGAFNECIELQTIEVDEENIAYSNDEFGVLFNKSKTELICYPSGNHRSSYTIPYGVKTIGFKAFCDSKNIESVIIPNTVTSIVDEAFYGCQNLVSVTIPNSVTSIEEQVFTMCSSLTSITVDEKNSVYSSDDGVLFTKNTLVQYPAGNSRTTYKIPDNVKYIGQYAFYSCDNLTTIDISDSATRINRWAFAYCDNLTTVTIGNGVIFIDAAFRDCAKIADVYYTGDIAGWCAIDFNTNTSNPIYYGSKLYINGKLIEDLIIPEGVKSIGRNSFCNYDNLTSVEIPDSVTSIGKDAFYYCDNLTSVTIGNGVTIINSGAFRYCDNLTDVYYNGTEEQWNEITVESYNDPLINATIHFLGEDVHECDYTAVVTSPTCQSQGYTTYTCEECGDSYVDDYTDIVDHYYLDGKCIWCGDTNVTPSSIIDITYTPSDSARKLFTVTCAERASMIQFIEPDGGTRTYYRNNANVKITSYNADGEVVGELSRDLAYEVWEIYSNMSIGTTIKVRAKFNSRWELDKRSLVVYEYNPVISMELSKTSGKKGSVPATVVADAKTEKVMFKMPNNTSVTISAYTTDENGNRVFTGKAWANEDGLNEINVYVRRKNVWKLVGTLEYTVE